MKKAILPSWLIDRLDFSDWKFGVAAAGIITVLYVIVLLMT